MVCSAVGGWGDVVDLGGLCGAGVVCELADAAVAGEDVTADGCPVCW